MKKLLMACAAAAMTAGAMAAQNDLLISFSTPGPDNYADGTAVLDGECYALVWSKDGNFEGIKADGAPVDANDAVVLVAPLAKGGRCPELVFQVPASKADGEYKDGQFDMYLLDTRVKAADGTTALAALENGKPVAVNASAAVAEKAAAGADSNFATAAVSASAASGASVTAAAVVDSPVITGIKVDGAKVTLTVDGLSPVATYKVLAGDKPGSIATEVKATEKDGSFEFEKPAGSFFKVIGVRNF